jgi:hypothetical protein
MGASYARNGLGLERPRVGLLNNGTEEHKGRAELKAAHDLIATNAPDGGYDFVGFVEGGDIPSARVDVIVTDGFTGNVALKTGEGTAALIRDFLKDAFKATPLSRIAALLALTSLRRLTKRIDPRRVNGGVFLGLNGTVVKSHGSADATGISAAIKLAYKLAASGFNERLAARVASLEMPGQDTAHNGQRASSTHDNTRRRPRRRALPARTRGPERRVRGDARHLRRMDRSRTGIERRHFAAEGQTTSDLAARAARAALADAGCHRRHRRDHRRHLDADLTFPSAATMVQAELGMTKGFAFDVQAVCAGFVFAMVNANALIVSGQAAASS